MGASAIWGFETRKSQRLSSAGALLLIANSGGDGRQDRFAAVSCNGRRLHQMHPAPFIVGVFPAHFSFFVHSRATVPLFFSPAWNFGNPGEAIKKDEPESIQQMPSSSVFLADGSFCGQSLRGFSRVNFDSPVRSRWRIYRGCRGSRTKGLPLICSPLQARSNAVSQQLS